MESYLNLYIGRLDGDADPWMEFIVKEKMERKQRGGKEQSTLFATKNIREEHRQENDKQIPNPEEYCFYGVEGNPVFTRKLRGLEFFFMGIDKGGSKPEGGYPSRGAPTVLTHFSDVAKGLRPLRHIHFFTETVVASHNGPTDLHVDAVSADHVGSSLLASHKYARIGGEKVNVKGVTLDWLLQQVLSGFVELPNAHTHGIRTSTTDIMDSGGHLILKIDIEGAEYLVLKEALMSGLLCDYATKKGKRVDLVVEFHRWVIEDKKQKEEFALLERLFYHKFSSCGVHLTKMDRNWH